MHPDENHRILFTSLEGALLFCVFVVGNYDFWPWVFVQPQHVPFLYFWLLLGTTPIYNLLMFGMVGLIFGALIGIPYRWWWGPIIGIVIGVTFASIELVLWGIPLDEGGVIFCIMILLLGGGLGSLLRAGIFLPSRIEPSRRAARILAQIAVIVVLVGTGLLLGRVFVDPSTSPVEILSIYQNAQAKNWKIQSIEFEGLLVPDGGGTGLQLNLRDGRKIECIYWQSFQDTLPYPNGWPTKSIDVLDAIQCPYP